MKLLCIKLLWCRCADSVCVRGATQLGWRGETGSFPLVTAVMSADPGMRERSQSARDRRVRARSISRVVSPARDTSVFATQSSQAAVALAQGFFYIFIKYTQW